MLKVSDSLMDWYGNEMEPKRQGPTMPRVTTNNRRMTNIHLGDGEYIQGIRKNPFVDPQPSELPDLTPPPAHKPLRYTPGLVVDQKLEVMRPTRCMQHPALSGLDLAPTKEPLDSSSRPYQNNAASPMDYASSYPQDELSRIKLRNRQTALGASSSSTGGYILITPNGDQVPLAISNNGGLSCAREAQMNYGYNSSVQGYADFEPLEELKLIRTADRAPLTSVHDLPRPRTLVPSSFPSSEARRRRPVSATPCCGKRRPGDFGVPEHIAIRTVLLTSERKPLAPPTVTATPPSTPQQEAVEQFEDEEEEEEVAAVTPPSQEDEPSAPLNTPLNEDA